MNPVLEESQFVLSSAEGGVLRGLLTAAQNSSDVAVVLLPAGLKYQVGPGRLNVRLARSLAARGYRVLRFDPLGSGESDGRVEVASINQVWNSIGQGAWVPQILQVCREVRSRFAVRHLIVGGLCGGAVSAQLAAAAAPDLIQGVLSFCTAVTLPDAQLSGVAPVHYAMAEHHMQAYRKKIFSPESWQRLLQGESNIPGILAVLQAQLSRLLSRGLSRLSTTAAALPSSDLPNQNPLFLPSFRHLQACKVAHLLLFGRSDNRWAEFQNAVLAPHLGNALQGDFYEIGLIADANHELHLDAWKDQAIALVVQWLAHYFPGSALPDQSISQPFLSPSQPV